MKKHIPELIILALLLFAALWLRYSFPYAELLWLGVGLLAGSFWLFSAVTGFGSGSKGKNKGYSAFVSIAFMWMLMYSIFLNFQPIRMLLPEGFWRFMDVSSVMLFGALALFALSNLSRVTRSLRKKEDDAVIRFYAAMSLRVACVLMLFLIPPYGPNFDTSAPVSYPVRATTSSFSASKTEALTTLIQQYKSQQGIKGISVYIRKGGQEAELHGGYLSEELNRPPRASDVYAIASVSKTLTASLLATYYRQGVLDSLTTIGDVLKDESISEDLAAIRLVDLATHHSGLSRLGPSAVEAVLKNFMNPYGYYTQPVFLKDLASAKVKKPADHAYSNFGYGVLGYVLTRYEQMQYSQGRGLLQLMRMRLSSDVILPQLAISNQLPEDQSVRSGSYAANGKSMPHWKSESMHGMGLFMASLSDMKIWANYHVESSTKATFGRDDLSWWTINYYQTKASREDQKQRLAWVEQQINVAEGPSKRTKTMYWHNGSTFGNTSFVGFMPSDTLSVVVLSNTGVTVDPLAVDLVKGVFR